MLWWGIKLLTSLVCSFCGMEISTFFHITFIYLNVWSFSLSFVSNHPKEVFITQLILFGLWIVTSPNIFWIHWGQRAVPKSKDTTTCLSLNMVITLWKMTITSPVLNPLKVLSLLHIFNTKSSQIQMMLLMH